ncbi:MAG: hypothetical protein NC217_06250 [Muribaculaceae bacterium]|nr:hypothetical protein [Muribaculaceae bacterium]
MKKVLTLFAAVLLTSWASIFAQDADTESLVGQTYTGQTTEVPDGTTWLNANTSPGVYSSLKGTYTIDLSSVYYMISNYANFTEGKVLVVNEDNTIVYEAKMTLTPQGGRYFNQMGVIIPEEDAITTPGTYRFIYPTSSGWDVTNDAYFNPRSSTPIYNLVAGPYIVGEIGSPVDAQVTVEPQGDFDADNAPQYVSVTVDNASIFNCEDIDAVITVKDNNGNAIQMEPGQKQGNTLKWEFPYDTTTGKAAILSKGTYTITVNYNALTAYTQDLHPLEFPTANTYTFNIEGGVTKIVPECTITPTPGHYDSWTAKSLLIDLNNCKPVGYTATELKNLQLVILDPDMESTTYTAGRVQGTQTGYRFGYQVTSLPKEGTYKCIWKVEGINAAPTDGSDNVELLNYEFEYTIGNPPVDATYTVEPAENASMTTDELTEVKITITNATSVEVAADAPSLLSIINDETQETTQLGAPTVVGNTLTWAMPASWAPAAGSYSIAIFLAEGVSGTTADGAKIQFPDNIEYTVTLTEPIRRDPVDPNPTFTPAAGEYTKWTATTITCTWDKTYKLNKDGRDMYIGRTIKIQKPDGSVQEIVLTKATESGVGKINYLLTNINVSADMFTEPGIYTVTFPIQGLIGYEVDDPTHLIEFDRDAIVEYTIVEPKVDAAYTITPTADTVYAPTDVVTDIVLTITNAKSVSIVEGSNPLSVIDTIDNTTVEMSEPVVSGNTITWKFPEGWDNPAGTYTVTIEPTLLSAVGLNGETVIFPEQISTNFVIEAPVVTPQFTVSPEPGEYHTWVNETGIFVSLTDYYVESEELSKAVKLTITGPDNESREYLPIAEQSGSNVFSYAVTDEFINKIGVYNCVLDLDGIVARNIETSKKVKLQNISFAYEMYGKPIDAELTLTPAAGSIYSTNDEIPAVVLTVANAVNLSINEGANPISVIETIENASVEMAAPVIEGNTITWQYADGWTKGAGTYTVTINPNDLAGIGADKAEIIFPFEISTNFAIAADATPQFSVYPEPGEYHTWDNAAGIRINLNDYMIATEELAKNVKLIITAPDNEVKEYLPNADSTGTNFLTYDVTDEFINKIGIYNCVVALDGVDGLDTQIYAPVYLQNISFAYEMYGKPIDAVFEFTPATDAIIAPTDVVPGIVLTVSNALSLNIQEGVNLIQVIETEGSGYVEMSAPVVDGNTITWQFPAGWDNPAGTYSVTVLTTFLSGIGADKAEVIFPMSTSSSFVIEAPVVTPTFSVNPEPGEYHTWDNELGVQVSLTDCLIAGQEEANSIKLNITAPNGDTKQYTVARTSGLSTLSFDVTDEFINQLGEYTFIVELDGVKAFNIDTNKKVKLTNISFAYTMYAKPIDAVLNLTPAKNTVYAPADAVGDIVLTVDNALTLSIAEGENPITVVESGENVAVAMSAPAIEGNKVTWKYPKDWNSPAGQYNVTIDLSKFVGTGADDAEVIFPADITTNFTIEAAVVTPEYEASPVPGDYTYWYNDMPVTISITGYELNSLDDAKGVQLVVTNPNGDSKTFLPDAELTGKSILVYYVTEADMAKLGGYTFTVKLAGKSGIDIATGKKVKFEDLYLFYTMTPLEVELNCNATPSSGSAFGVWTDSEIVIDWSAMGFTLEPDAVEELKEKEAVINRDGLPIARIALSDMASAQDANPFEAAVGAVISTTGMTLNVDPATFKEDGDYEVIIPTAHLIGNFAEESVKVEFINDLKLDYKIDISLGVDTIYMTGEGEALYHINGYRVNRATEKGIYIKIDANGKASRIYVK